MGTDNRRHCDVDPCGSVQDVGEYKLTLERNGKVERTWQRDFCRLCSAKVLRSIRDVLQHPRAATMQNMLIEGETEAEKPEAADANTS